MTQTPETSGLPFRRKSSALALAGAVAACALASLATSGVAHAEPAPIVLDGVFDDWTGPVEHVDPAEGGALDLREVDLAHDADFLFVRFQTTGEVGIQANGNQLHLYIDRDANPSTGFPIGGIGAELRWDFGAKTGCFDVGHGCTSVGQDDLRLRMLPSVTASEFEIAIARDVRPDGANELFPQPTFRIVIVYAATPDYAPNSLGLEYTFAGTPPAPPAAIPFARNAAADVRLVTWNTRDLEVDNGGGAFSAPAVAAADRVLSAIAPDILCFQEVYQSSAAQMRTLVESMLPERAPWHSAKQADCAVVSRYPVLQSWGLDGNLAVLLDTNAAWGTHLLLVNAHTPCCTNDTGREREIDRIMAFFRDAMTPGGIVNVPQGTAFAIAGDLNLVGFARQLETLLTGDILDNATFGPDFAPDWDGTGLADVISRQTERRFAYTWRNDAGAFAPGRLDFVIFSDGVLQLRNHFVVYSPEMSEAQRAPLGILAGDVPAVSDHLPLVADFRAGDVAGVPELDPMRMVLDARSSIGEGEIRLGIGLGSAASLTLEVFDAGGRRVRSVYGTAGLALGAGRHTLVWDGRDDHGAAATGGVYFARVTARFTAHRTTQSLTARGILLR